MKCIETDVPQQQAGQVLTEALMKHAGTPVLLMVSGGSAFSMLEHVDPSVLGPHITLCVLDERFSPDPAVHNFAQLEATNFFARAMAQGVNTISTKIHDNESLEDLQNRFSASLHEWKKEYPQGVVIATMGIGPDGHTAGIFAGEYGVDFDDETWVAGYTVPESVNQYTKRVTVTKTFLREVVDEAIVYAVGPDKQTHLKALCTGVREGYDAPVSVFFDMRAVTIVTGR